MHGSILDPTRAPIPDARIIAVREGGASELSAVSDRNGEFSVALEPGTYTVKASAKGFLESSQTVTLAENGSESREFVLRLAGVRDTVTVTESAGYQTVAVSTATKTLTPLRDVPQSITVVPQEQMKDQMMMSIGDVVRYVPGITAIQGENNRDQLVIRGNSTSADFFLDGVRDDVQYYRDLYNLDRVEALKGPNAMMFGRGGGGGVVNRVSKDAGFTPIHEFTLLGGSFGNKRFTADFDQPLNDKVAVRLNAMYENSDSFRKYVNLERHGINPTLTYAPGKNTRITLDYENFSDDRVADRGITSFQGRPADVDRSTYYGDPNQSHVRARVNLGSATVEHQAGRVTIRNRTTVGNYDRIYQNFVPGAVTADRSQVPLSAYNNATKRLNAFNQTDVTYSVETGPIRHKLLAGAEIGRQLTDNFRNTGYFNNSVTSILVPYSDTVINTPVTFRQSVTDADNHLKTNVAATYVQDQIDLSRHFQVIAGLRFDHFDLQYHNNRTGENLRRIDNLVSPRAGIVYKPIDGALDLHQLQRVLSAQFRGPVLLPDHHHAAGETGEVQQLRSGSQVGRLSVLLGHHGGLPLEPHQYAIYRSQRSHPDRADRQPANEWLRAWIERECHAAMEDRWRICLSGRVRHQRHHRREGGGTGGAGAAPYLLDLEQLPDPAEVGGRPGHSEPIEHVRGDRQHGDACRAIRARTRPCTIRSPSACVCRRTWKICSTRSTTSMRTATRTYRRASRERCARDSS